MRVSGESSDCKHFSDILCQEVCRDDVSTRASPPIEGHELTLAMLLRTMDEAFLPLHILSMRVQAITDSISCIPSSFDGFIAGVDLSLVVAC